MVCCFSWVYLCGCYYKLLNLWLWVYERILFGESFCFYFICCLGCSELFVLTVVFVGFCFVGLVIFVLLFWVFLGSSATTDLLGLLC